MTHRSASAIPGSFSRRERFSLVSLLRGCTWARLWRLFLVALMSSLSVLGLWGGLLVPAAMALAASHPAAPLPSTTLPPRQGTYAASISSCPSRPKWRAASMAWARWASTPLSNRI